MAKKQQGSGILVLDEIIKGGFVEYAERIGVCVGLPLVKSVTEVMTHDPFGGYLEKDVRNLAGAWATDYYVARYMRVLEEELDDAWVREVGNRLHAPCVVKRGGAKNTLGVICSEKKNSIYGNDHYYIIYDLDSHKTKPVSEKSLKSRVWRVGEKGKLDSLVLEESPFDRNTLVAIHPSHNHPDQGRIGRVLGWGESVKGVKTLLKIPVQWHGDTAETWVLASILAPVP